MRIPFFSTALSGIRPRLSSALLDEICDKGTHIHIASRDEIFQYAASIVSIAAGILLRRSSLPFVPRGEFRDLPYLDRSGRSRDRRDHQFPLLSIDDAQAPFREAMESIRRGHWANRQSSRIVPPCS
jgi:hypothetical protein